MQMSHYDGIILEHIVSEVFSCDRSDLGGIVNSDVFEHNPLLASYLIIAKLYRKSETQDCCIEKFVNKWETIFKYPDENEKYTFKEYIDELRDLIENLKL